MALNTKADSHSLGAAGLQFSNCFDHYKLSQQVVYNHLPRDPSPNHLPARLTYLASTQSVGRSS